jgi:excisionase family DNA binding protein
MQEARHGKEERPTYTVPEAARELGIGKSLLWRLIGEGRVPVLRLGHRTLVTRHTIEALLAEGSLHVQTPQSAAAVRILGARRG